ncbi:13756_t:CDS:2, partial [Dentiscutata heterogama]
MESVVYCNKRKITGNHKTIFCQKTQCCYCKQFGHINAFCPNLPCYLCHVYGHTQRTCIGNKEFKPKKLKCKVCNRYSDNEFCNDIHIVAFLVHEKDFQFMWDYIMHLSDVEINFSAILRTIYKIKKMYYFNDSFDKLQKKQEMDCLYHGINDVYTFKEVHDSLGINLFNLCEECYNVISNQKLVCGHYSKDHNIQYQNFKEHVIVRNANYYLIDRLYFDNKDNLRLAYNGIKRSGRKLKVLSNDEKKNKNVIAQRRHQDRIQIYMNSLEEQCELNRNNVFILEEEVKKMKLENEHVQKELKDYRKQVQDLKRINEILNNENQNLNDSITELNEEVQKLDKNLKDYQDANKEFVKHNNKMMIEIEELKKQINKRDEKLDQFKTENEELKKQIDENVTNNKMIENIGLTSIDGSIGLTNNEMINEDWKIFSYDFKPSYLLKYLIKELKLKYREKYNVAVTASTSIAALNINGITIHNYSNIVLIIDEISILSCDVLDLINEILQEIRGNQKLFGGVQLIVTAKDKEKNFDLPPHKQLIEYLDKKVLAKELLYLKVGVKVISIFNDKNNKGIVNGTFGVVVGFKSKIHKKIYRIDGIEILDFITTQDLDPVVKFDNIEDEIVLKREKFLYNSE